MEGDLKINDAIVTKLKTLTFFMEMFNADNTNEYIALKQFKEKLNSDIDLLLDNKEKIIERFMKKCDSVKCIETGEIFETESAAAKAFGISSSGSISNVLHGKAKTAGGYKWELIKNETNNN